MTCDSYVVSRIVEAGTRDAFGIPGGVILPFLYALEKNPNIEPHLNYHEQASAFSALGYAQASGKLGVAYATRGPGISNMFTAIAEAYQEAVPVLFITAHGKRDKVESIRFTANQELDIVEAVRRITKCAFSVEEIDQVESAVTKAIHIAVSGRKGPVLLDMASHLWDMEVELKGVLFAEHTYKYDADSIVQTINEAKRPIILIGDGLRYTVSKDLLLHTAEKIKIPIVSSRGSQDLLSGSHYYFGYIGSHGVRYSNFILSKADVVVAIGNRMAFPFDSLSFSPVLKKKIIRIDIDDGEFLRSIPGGVIIQADAGEVFNNLKGIEEKTEWIHVCNELRDELNEEDCSEPVPQIIDFIRRQDDDVTYVCDVGNNEFWFSRAYERSGCTCKVLMSKSFGTLGSAIGKAIGAYYADKRKVVCVSGDQGFQFNIQELQYVSRHHLPIQFLIINNHCSRMIADHEEKRFPDRFVHVNKESGYSVPDFFVLADAYGVGSNVTEITVDEKVSLEPSLPRGGALQDMSPMMDRERYKWLDRI